MSTKTGQRMVGINVGTNARVKNDFYPTPKSTTDDFLSELSSVAGIPATEFITGLLKSTFKSI